MNDKKSPTTEEVVNQLLEDLMQLPSVKGIIAGGFLSEAEIRTEYRDQLMTGDTRYGLELLEDLPDNLLAIIKLLPYRKAPANTVTTQLTASDDVYDVTQRLYTVINNAKGFDVAMMNPPREGTLYVGYEGAAYAVVIRRVDESFNNVIKGAYLHNEPSK